MGNYRNVHLIFERGEINFTRIKLKDLLDDIIGLVETENWLD